MPRAQLGTLLDALSHAAPADSRKVAWLPQGTLTRYTVELVGAGTDRVLLASGGTANLYGLPLTLFWRGSLYTLISPESAVALLDVLALLAHQDYGALHKRYPVPTALPLRPLEHAPFVLPDDNRVAFNWGSFHAWIDPDRPAHPFVTVDLDHEYNQYIASIRTADLTWQAHTYPLEHMAAISTTRTYSTTLQTDGHVLQTWEPYRMTLHLQGVYSGGIPFDTSFALQNSWYPAPQPLGSACPANQRPRCGLGDDGAVLQSPCPAVRV